MALLSIKLKSFLKGTALGTYLRRRNWNRQILSPTNARKVVDKYMPSLSEEEKQTYVCDILSMARKYRFSAEEYFYYHFKDKTEEERASFLSDLNRIDFCESVNLAKNLAIFNDKFKSAQVFGKYYGRDFCGVKSQKDLSSFAAFLEKHPKFILKPLSGACGQGIKILTLSPNDTDAISAIFKEYCTGAEDGFIAEELVVQVEEMAKFHPKSLNTIRVATIRFPEGVEVVASFFRTGRGESIVDNAGAGGVFGNIDVQTGTVLAAADEFGVFYTEHPDTGVPYTGFTIPRWDEAVALAKELATVVEGNRYAGWDLALTEKGWVMIEGNARGQFVWQIPTQKGFLKEANQILERLGKRKMTHLGV